MKIAPLKDKRIGRTAFCLALALLSAALFSCAAASVPEPSDVFYVYDETGTLSDETKDRIITANDSLSAETGAQIVVAVVRTTGDADIADIAYEIFEKWEIGDRDRENGLLLLISKEEDDYWAVQGRGLEEILTSGTLKLMLDAYLEPQFAKGDIDGGVRRFFEAAVKFFSDAYSVSIPDGQQSVAPETAGSGRTQGIVSALSAAAKLAFAALLIVAAVVVILALAGRGSTKPAGGKTEVPKPGQIRLGGSDYDFGAGRTGGINVAQTAQRKNTAESVPKQNGGAADWGSIISTAARAAFIASQMTRGSNQRASQNRPSAPRSGTSGSSFGPTPGNRPGYRSGFSSSPRGGSASVSRGGSSAFSRGSSGSSGASHGGSSSFSRGSSGSSGVSRGGGGGGTRGGGAGRR